MIEVENTDVNIVRNLIPMRNFMPASAYGLKAISDWFYQYRHYIFNYFGCWQTLHQANKITNKIED